MLCYNPKFLVTLSRSSSLSLTYHPLRSLSTSTVSEEQFLGVALDIAQMEITFQHGDRACVGIHARNRYPSSFPTLVCFTGLDKNFHVSLIKGNITFSQ